MNNKLLKTLLILLILKTNILPAQVASSDNEIIKKKFFTEIELNVGTSIMYPTLYYQASHSEEEIKFGSSVMLGVSHQTLRRLEITAFISINQEKYSNAIYDSQDKTNRLTGEVKNSYIIATLMPRYQFGKSRQFNFGVGCYIGSLQKSKTSLTVSYPGNSGSSTSFYDSYGTYKKSDFGLSVSAGYQIEVNKKYALTILIINNNGLYKINNYTTADVLSIEKNNSVSLLIGVVLKR